MTRIRNASDLSNEIPYGVQSVDAPTYPARGSNCLRAEVTSRVTTQKAHEKKSAD